MHIILISGSKTDLFPLQDWTGRLANNTKLYQVTAIAPDKITYKRFPFERKVRDVVKYPHKINGLINLPVEIKHRN